MKIENTQPTSDPPKRVKVNQRHCIVCGAANVQLMGQLFYQTGRSKFGAPYCKNHALSFKEYACPVFENTTALNLFKYMYPNTYKKAIEGKPILFFDTYKHKTLQKNNSLTRTGEG